MTHHPLPSERTDANSDAAPLPSVHPGAWLLGNLREFWRDPADLLVNAYSRWGPVFRLRAAVRSVTFIAGDEAVEFIERGLDKKFLSRRCLFAAVHREFGPTEFVFEESGAEHARLRRLLAIAYSRQVVSPFVPALVATARRHASRWPVGSRLSVVPHLSQMAFAQYCDLLGSGAQRLRHRDGQLTTDYQMNVTAGFLPSIVFKAPWYRAAHKRMHGVLWEMVRARQRYGPESGPPCIFDTLATVRDGDGVPFSDQAVVSYSTVGIAGSCGNVTRLAAFMLYEILKDPERLNEIVPEVQAAFAQGLRDATDVRRMRMLRSVYDETLRFHPISLGLPFDVDRDFTYCGRRVRKGDLLVISPVPASFSSKTYRDPHTFDPSRCLDPRNEHRRGATLPFGLGERTCVAMGLVELMVITLVATVLHDYDVVLDPPDYKLQLTTWPLPGPNRRFRMRVAGPRLTKTMPSGVTRKSEEEAFVTFPGHDHPSVQQALSRATRRRFDAGIVIIREGDVADAFYLVEKGRVTVTREIGGVEQQLATLNEGDWFGEVGLLQNMPRNATVTAGPDGADTVVLDRESFLGMVATSDLVAGEIGQLLRKRVAITRLRQALSSLSAKAAGGALPEFDSRLYAPGETILTQGDPAEEFFILVEGEAVVSRVDTSGNEAVIARLSPGDYFGEMGLLHGTPRNATVTAAATQQVRTLVSGRAGFERLLAADERGELASAMLARVERLGSSD